MNTETKLCTGCKYYRPQLFVEPYCAFRLSRVDGSAAGICSIERMYDGRCGPDAKNFKPMPPFKWFWQK